MSQAWYTANTLVRFFLNVPGLVHHRYTSLVLFECPRPSTLQIHQFGSFQVSRASPPWVHQLGSFGVFQGVPLPVEGKPLGHSKRTKLVYLWCTMPGKLEMDPGEKPTQRIRLENYECIKGI